jgi:hypothetical protein
MTLAFESYRSALSVGGRPQTRSKDRQEIVELETNFISLSATLSGEGHVQQFVFPPSTVK